MDLRTNVLKEFSEEALAALGVSPGDTLPEPFVEIPAELQRAARLKLAQAKAAEARVSATSGGKLSKWAAKKRKALRKTADASRRRNRKN